MPNCLSAPAEILEAVERLIAEKFDRLRHADPGLRIAWLVAGDVTQAGHEAAWKARVTNQEQRASAADCPDVVVVINTGVWQNAADDETREGILAEALYAIRPEWVRSTSNAVKTDVLGRPKVRLKRPDVYIAGYREVASWYGRKALLTHAVATAAQDLEQQVMGFLGSPGRREAPSERIADALGPDVSVTVGGRRVEALEQLGEALFGKKPAKRGLAEDTFAALLLVGHTEAAARGMIERALATGRTFGGVSELIDAIYQAEPPAAAAPPPPANDDQAGDLDAELAAGAAEGYAAKGWQPCRDCAGVGCDGCEHKGWVPPRLIDGDLSEPAWRSLPVSELVKHGLDENVVNILTETEGFADLGDLFDSVEAGELAEDAPSLSDDELDEVLAARRHWQRTHEDLPPREWTTRELPEDLRGLMTDVSVNDHGVYEHPEELVIEMPKSWKCGATLKVVQGNDGRWRTAYDYRVKNGSVGGLPSVRDRGHETRLEAIGVVAAQVGAIFEREGERWASVAVSKFVAGLAAAEGAAPRHPTRDELEAADPEGTAERRAAFNARTAPDAPWRELGVPTLKLPGPTHAALLDDGLKTLGDLADFLRDTGLSELGVARRWGVSTAEVAEIRDALARYAAAPARPAPAEPEHATFLVFKGSNRKPEYAIRAASLLDAIRLAKGRAGKSYTPRVQPDETGKADALGLEKLYAPPADQVEAEKREGRTKRARKAAPAAEARA